MGVEVAVALRNEQDPVQLPVLGLQEAGGKLSKLLTDTFASGNFHVAPATTDEAKDRLVDIFSCLARICGETAVLMERLAACQHEARGDDPNQP
jgi:hypothetical protein